MSGTNVLHAVGVLSTPEAARGAFEAITSAKARACIAAELSERGLPLDRARQRMTLPAPDYAGIVGKGSVARFTIALTNSPLRLPLEIVSIRIDRGVSAVAFISQLPPENSRWRKPLIATAANRLAEALER